MTTEAIHSIKKPPIHPCLFPYLNPLFSPHQRPQHLHMVPKHPCATLLQCLRFYAPLLLLLTTAATTVSAVRATSTTTATVDNGAIG